MTNEANRFKDKDGFPTAYAFTCGHQMVHETKNNVRIVLWQECPVIPSYHVRAHDHENGKRLFWETYPSIGEAKKVYQEACKRIP